MAKKNWSPRPANPNDLSRKDLVDIAATLQEHLFWDPFAQQWTFGLSSGIDPANVVESMAEKLEHLGLAPMRTGD